MIKLERFDGLKTYMFPNGDIATPERIVQDFPAVAIFPHVLEVNGNVCQAVMELMAMRAMHNIDESLSDDDAIELMEAIINAPPPESVPSAEERIAAAMEFDNLMKY